MEFPPVEFPFEICVSAGTCASHQKLPKLYGIEKWNKSTKVFLLISFNAMHLFSFGIPDIIYQELIASFQNKFH